MKILIFGAGVMGSLYAFKLKQAGFDTTILARRERVKQIQSQGILFEDFFTQEKTTTYLPVVEQLSLQDEYDLVAVHVRGNHLDSVIPSLTANKKIKTILFMLNYPEGIEKITDQVGSDRSLIGFPGGGGWIDAEGVVHASIAPGFAQPTTLGEIHGRITSKIKELAKIYAQAGFPISISSNIDAWLKTHVAWTLPLECMLYKFDFDSQKIAKDNKSVSQIVKGVKEGMQVLKALKIPLTPMSIKFIFYQAPKFVAIFIVHWWLESKNAKVYTVMHTKNAPDEAKFLADEFNKLITKSTIKTLTLNELYSYIPRRV